MRRAVVEWEAGRGCRLLQRCALPPPPDAREDLRWPQPRDAARLVDSRAGAQAGVDVGYPLGQRGARRRVEVGVEHAVPAAELELQPDALTDLQRGGAEPLRKIARGKADQPPLRLRAQSDRRRHGQGLRIGGRNAAGKGED